MLQSKFDIPSPQTNADIWELRTKLFADPALQNRISEIRREHGKVLELFNCINTGEANDPLSPNVQALANDVVSILNRGAPAHENTFREIAGMNEG